MMTKPKTHKHLNYKEQTRNDNKSLSTANLPLFTR